jgi:spore germination protein
MYARMSMILFPVAMLALIGTAYWGYQQNHLRSAMEIKAENQYQRAFHDLAYHMDSMQKELGNTLVANSASQQAYKKGLLNVWRMTNEAQSEINQLPLGRIPVNKTQEFLTNMANFTYQTAIRDHTKNPLTPAEITTLGNLQKHATEITDELRKVQGKTITNKLTWMDAEKILANSKGPQDNMILDGFKNVDKSVSGYSDVEFSPSTLNIFQKHDPNSLPGMPMTTAGIQKKAAEFWNLPNSASSIKVKENGQAGAEYNSFTATVPGKTDKDVIEMDFTKKGGHLVYFMHDRNVSKSTLDIRGARDAANAFLDEHGYKDMSAVSYDQYQNSANITFARKDQDIILYPEKLVVKVALDNGDVTSLQATDYIYAHKARKLKQPTMTIDNVKQKLNPNLKVSDTNKAVILNDSKQEVLCYEFVGKMGNNGLFRVYLNADTGEEEKIENIRQEDVQATS